MERQGMDKEPDHGLLNEKQVAQRLGVSRITVHRLRKRNAIGYFRIGNKVFYSQNHVNDYLESVESKRR